MHSGPKDRDSGPCVGHWTQKGQHVQPRHRLNGVPEDLCVEALSPGPQNMTGLRNRVIAGGLQG